MLAIRRGWFHLASGAGVGRVLGLFSNLLLSRWLGPTELGLFNLVTATVQASDTLVRCGGDYAVNYILGGQPEATKSQGGIKLAKGFAQLCSLTTATICVVVAIWVWWGQGLFPSELVASHRFLFTCLLLVMIACEGSSASAWELLLVTHRTAPLALKQGLFFPLRLLFAAIGALHVGVLGAMCGWSLMTVVQSLWLKQVLGHLWSPLQLWPIYVRRIRLLLYRGFPFYAANLLSSMIFYPLLLQVATSSGLSEIGYLRVGQILQQLFAFLPSTFVPVLFLRLRSESSYAAQASLLEKPLRLIWLLLLEILLLYCIVDHSLIIRLFGNGFASALLPTRLLLITALFECLAQLAVQPLLATGKTRFYGLWQNGVAVLAAALGWFWIPEAGLTAYLIVRLLYVAVPLIAFAIPLVKNFKEPQKIASLFFVSAALLAVLIIQIIYGDILPLTTPLLISVFVAILLLHCQDLLFVTKVLRRA